MEFQKLVAGAALDELRQPLRLLRDGGRSWQHTPEEYAQLIIDARIASPDPKTATPSQVAHAIRLITGIGDRYLSSSFEDRLRLVHAFQNHREEIKEKYLLVVSAWHEYLSSAQDKESIPNLSLFGLKATELMLQGKQFRLCSDVSDTLGLISADKKVPFEGVADALAALLQTSRVDLLSGDALPNVIDGFLKPAGLHPDPSCNRYELSLLDNLHLKGRYGLDAMQYCAGEADFTVTNDSLPGIPHDIAQNIIKQWDVLCEEHKIAERFESRLETKPGKPFGCYELHPLDADGCTQEQADNMSLMFFMVGHLTALSRTKFKHASCCSADRALMDQLAFKLNQHCQEHVAPALQAQGLTLIVEQEGVSTIATRTADKGVIMDKLKEHRADNEIFVFAGDCVFRGNDKPGAEKADFAIQVGEQSSITPNDFASAAVPTYWAAQEGRNRIADYFMHIARLNAAYEVLFAA